MAKTARECCLILIWIGVMIFFLNYVLVPNFGPKPLANPVAGAIFAIVMITCFCLLMMNRVIIAKISSLEESKKCPECRTKLENNATFCPNCEFMVQHTQEQGISQNEVLEREAQEIRRTVVRSINTREGKLRWIKEQYLELKRPIQEIADDLGVRRTIVINYIDEIEKADST